MSDFCKFKFRGESLVDKPWGISYNEKKRKVRA